MLKRLLWRAGGELDKILDSFTSYKLVLYCLYVYAGMGLLLAAAGSLPFKWYHLAGSIILLVAVCWAANEAISRFLNIPKNKESDLITAFILALILSPAATMNEYLILAVAAIAAIASKYILTFAKRHIFNPAALGAVTIALFLNHYASWWIGTKALAPLVLVGGILILRKMKRFTMFFVFIASYLVFAAINISSHHSPHLTHLLWIGLIESPVLFLATIMLTEPSTSPHHARNYLPYTLLVAALYSFSVFKLSPEESLLIGNVAAFALEPWRRLQLSLVRVKKEAEGIYSFIFKGKSQLQFEAGQYMEWTLPLAKSDSRGNRRYLTLASSPTENEVMFSVKVPPHRSSFKTQLAQLKPGDHILASQLAGSFTLPKDQQQKLAFIAGGIGVTPFRSMIKYLTDSNQKRDLSLVYSVSKKEELAFTDIFSQAKNIGLKPHYVSKVDAQILAQAVPDHKDRLFYVSGPYGFVQVVQAALAELDVPARNIKTDYFPGYG